MNVCWVTCLYFCLFIVLTGSLLAVKLLHGIVWRCYGFVRSFLFGRICECNVIGKVEVCVKNVSWVFQPGTLVCLYSYLICMHIDLHVVLSECRNGTCESPIDFTGIKRALLCIVTCEAYGNAWERKMEIEIGRHRRLWRLNYNCCCCFINLIFMLQVELAVSYASF